MVDIQNLKQAIRLKLKSTGVTEEQEEFNKALADALNYSLSVNIDGRYEDAAAEAEQ